jgi:imidazolonepropionase-like amidohydrolase
MDRFERARSVSLRCSSDKKGPVKCIFTALVALAAPSIQAAGIVVTAAHIFHPTKGVMIDTVVIVIGDEGRVQALLSDAGEHAAIPTDAKRFDLGNLTILPVMIDMHVHLSVDLKPSGRGSNIPTISGRSSATSDAAIALDRASDAGQPTRGHYDDIAAVMGDPTKDVRLLEHPVWVIKGGHVVTAPAISSKGGQ